MDMNMYRAVIVGDAHFGARSHQASEDERQRLFVQLVQEMATQTSQLVLIGDLFDFWFEYPSVVPDYAVEVLVALARATERTRVLYLRGNHDLWAGKKLRSIGRGIEVVDWVDLEVSGRSLRILHGHQLSRHRLTHWFHKVVSHPLPVFLYRCLHPSLGFAFARWMARLSRLRNTMPKIPSLVGLHKISAEIVVIGHYHLPRIEQVGQQTLVVIGDWLLARTFTTVRDTAIEIRDYPSKRVLHALNLKS